MLLNPRRRLERHFVDSLDVLRIELAAIWGRQRQSKKIETRNKRYLQLGCGDRRIDGFLNTDFYLNRKAEDWIDLRFPLRFSKNTWKGVYAHHCVEHIDYTDAFNLFKEIHRVLEPGGIFRMVVPDLREFLMLYASPDSRQRREIFALLPEAHMEELKLKITTPLEMIDYLVRDNKFNRHLSSWDWETSFLRLRDAGFSNIIRREINISDDPMLAGHDNPNWARHSLYVEAIK